MAVRIFRRTAIVLGGVALLLIALAVVAPLLVSGDAFRARALRAAERAAGGDVELGEAKLRVFPRLAVTLRDGRLAGTGAGLRAAHGNDWGIAAYSADLDRVEVRVGLLPLLARRLEVREVLVEGSRLRLLRDGAETVAGPFRLTLRDLSLAVAAPAPAGADAPPGASIPEDLACRVALALDSLTVAGVTWTEVAADAELDGRVIEVPRAAARLDGGRVTGSATVDYARDPWGDLVFAYEATEVPAGSLLGPWLPDLARRLDARLTARGSGSCGLRDADAALATLDLTGTAGAGEGVLHAADWLQDVSPYLGRRQDLKDVRFSSLNHAYRFAQGRYLVSDLVLDGPDTSWRGSGWVGTDGNLDLALQVRLPAGFTPDLGAWSFLAESLRDEAGRVQLDLLLSGRTARPSVGLDLAALKTGTTDQGAEAVKKGVGGLLDKWKSK